MLEAVKIQAKEKFKRYWLLLIPIVGALGFFGLRSCGQKDTNLVNPTPVDNPGFRENPPVTNPTATLQSLQSGSETFTPTNGNMVLNPYTGVWYTIDANGCAIIPPGGTAYGGATVLGDPRNVFDMGPFQVNFSNGSLSTVQTDPKYLPELTHAGDRVCGVNYMSSRIDLSKRGFNPSKSSKPARSSTFRRG